MANRAVAPMPIQLSLLRSEGTDSYSPRNPGPMLRQRRNSACSAHGEGSPGPARRERRSSISSPYDRSNTVSPEPRMSASESRTRSPEAESEFAPLSAMVVKRTLQRNLCGAATPPEETAKMPQLAATAPSGHGSEYTEECTHAQDTLTAGLNSPVVANVEEHRRAVELALEQALKASAADMCDSRTAKKERLDLHINVEIIQGLQTEASEESSVSGSEELERGLNSSKSSTCTTPSPRWCQETYSQSAQSLRSLRAARKKRLQTKRRSLVSMPLSPGVDGLDRGYQIPCREVFIPFELAPKAARTRRKSLD